MKNTIEIISEADEAIAAPAMPMAGKPSLPKTST